MDGDLRALFRQHLPKFFWTAVETWPVSSGVPDAHYCAPGGIAGWLEMKKIQGWKIPWRAPYLQVAWHDRYARMGGRSFFAVRRGQDLYLVRGGCAKILLERGLAATPRAGPWLGGPARWDWGEIGRVLTAQVFTTTSEQDNPQEREESSACRAGPSPSPRRAARPK
jgi:hypothetical protein